MGIRLSLNFSGVPFAAVAKRVRGFLPDDVKRGIVEVMRHGPGSAAEQFAQQREFLPSGASRSWSSTRAFGSRAATSPTLQATGAYRAAWTGEGSGGRAEISGQKQIRIGVDQQRFPRVTVLQGETTAQIPVTRAMRMYLGQAFGVWLKPTTRFIRVKPRRIGVGKEAVVRVERVLAGYATTGKAVSA